MCVSWVLAKDMKPFAEVDIDSKNVCMVEAGNVFLIFVLLWRLFIIINIPLFISVYPLTHKI